LTLVSFANRIQIEATANPPSYIYTFGFGLTCRIFPIRMMHKLFALRLLCIRLDGKNRAPAAADVAPDLAI